MFIWTIFYLLCEISNTFSLGIIVTNTEVEKDTDGTLTCTVSGLTEQATIEWKSSPGGSAIISDDTNYVIGGTGFDSLSNSQQSTLTVKAVSTTADKTFYCAVTSTEWNLTDEETPVVLNVFGMFYYLTVLV